MKDQIKVDNQNNQEKTENIISGVIQKLKKPKVIVLVVLSVILSLGGIFAGVYYRQKQIVTNQEKKTIESKSQKMFLTIQKRSHFWKFLIQKIRFLSNCVKNLQRYLLVVEKVASRIFLIRRQQNMNIYRKQKKQAVIGQRTSIK